MSKVRPATVVLPEPYLGPLFEPGVEPFIATGFKYTPEEVSIHGVANHGAIDLDLPRGTKIIAPADGYYICTYGEILTRINRQPRTMSYDQVIKNSPDNVSLRPPDGDGESEREIYYGSFVVQGWHGNGRYTQYAHVDWVAPQIPYYPPTQSVDKSGQATGDLEHSLMLRAPVSDYRKPGVAAFIRAGEVIAEVGMTGCGWGQRCYDFAQFDANGRPDFRQADYFYYSAPHLHFVTFGRRASRSRNAKLIDPFGVYGDITAGYPQTRNVWHRSDPKLRHAPLWLPQ